MSDSSEFPRPLSHREAAVLAFMLSPDDPRLEPLRRQAEAVTVTGNWGCCATIDLWVDRSRAIAAPSLCSPVTETATIEKAPAERYHDLLLFLDDEGWLETLEIVHYAGSPMEFPPAEDFEPPQVRCERSAGSNSR
jgi:hypothetical protein